MTKKPEQPGRGKKPTQKPASPKSQNATIAEVLARAFITPNQLTNKHFEPDITNMVDVLTTLGDAIVEGCTRIAMGLHHIAQVLEEVNSVVAPPPEDVEEDFDNDEEESN